MIHFITKSKKIAIGCVIILMVLTLLLLGVYLILHSNDQVLYVYKETLINKSLPNFSLPVLGKEQQIVNQKILNNKVTLINIWSVKCRFCKREHYLLFDIVNYIKGKEINFIGLNCNNSEDQAILWLEKHGNPYDINLFDPGLILVTELEVGGLPDLLIIDSYGKVQYRYVGIITQKVWQQEIRPVIDQLYLNVSH
jgi:cytochrome c biogenesis protein CcmG, thiol:disulfide interchange protein DsbE